MKIAIVRKKYTFHGGAEGILHDLVMKLAAAGHEIHIFAISWDADVQSDNIVFHRVPAVTFNSFLRDLTFAVFSFYMLKKQRADFDIIQTHDKTLYQDVCFVADGCHIEWLRQRWKRRGLWGRLSIILNPYHWLILFIEKTMYNNHKFKSIFALSDLVKRDILQHYKVRESEIDVVYHWIDITKFHPDNKAKYGRRIREQYAIEEDRFVILFVGSGFERKGLRYLIEAGESLSEPVTILVVGKGSEEEFRGIIENQEVVFCGPRRDAYKYFAAADIFVLPSMYEPFGLVYLEAMASGLPVITTRHSGAAEIIDEGEQGFVIQDPEDTAAIAEKIRFFLDNKEVLNRMSRNARSRAEEYTFEKYIGKISGLYESIITEKMHLR